MRKLSTALAITSVIATGALADLNISIPAPATAASSTFQVGVDSTSAGAKAIKNLSGAAYYVGKASSASLTETTLGELSLRWSLVYTTADGAYGTSVGLLVPLTPAWDVKDLSAMTSITFQIKAATAGSSVHLIIGSDAYPADAASANASLVGAATAVTTSYSTVTVLPVDLAMPTWYSGADAATIGWTAGAGITTAIAPLVKQLNIQPILDPAWNATGSGFKTTAAALAATANTYTVKNIVIAGVSAHPDILGQGCTGPSYLLEDFAAAKGTSLAANYLGGYWFAYSDTVVKGPWPTNDSAVGSSMITLPTGAKAWKPKVDTGAEITATLEKNVPVAAPNTYLYHPYAGWAAVGTGIPGQNPDGSADFTSFASGNALTSISFDLYAGTAGGTFPTWTFDTVLVPGIAFKVSKLSVADAKTYQVYIPEHQGVGTPSICVDLTALAQPSWVTPANVAFVANDVTQLAWEMKIEDQKDPTKHTSGPNSFTVTNVKFWGMDATDAATIQPSAVKGRGVRANALKVTYGSSLVLSFQVAGSSAQVDVLRLDGSKVASFQTAPVANGLSLPVSLTHGAYLVAVRGANSRQVASLTVAR